MNKDTLNICFSSDENYAQHLGVTLLSVINTHPDENLNFYILDGGISEKSRNHILFLGNKKNVQIKFIKVDDDTFKNYKLPSESHFTSAIFYRFKIPELFSNLDKILYLDVDIVVFGNLHHFYDTDLKNYCFGMIKDWNGDECASRMSLQTYYNSGVMLFNIQECLKKNILSRLMDGLKDITQDLSYPDQDIINLTCQDVIKPVDFIYNAQVHPTDSKNISFIQNNLEKIKILHYTSAQKPWKSTFNPFEKFYLNLLKTTPWKDNLHRIYFLKFVKKVFHTIRQNNAKITYLLGIEILKKEHDKKTHEKKICLFKCIFLRRK